MERREQKIKVLTPTEVKQLVRGVEIFLHREEVRRKNLGIRNREEPGLGEKRWSVYR